MKYINFTMESLNLYQENYISYKTEKQNMTKHEGVYITCHFFAEIIMFSDTSINNCHRNERNLSCNINVICKEFAIFYDGKYSS